MRLFLAELYWFKHKNKKLSKHKEDQFWVTEHLQYNADTSLFWKC